MAHNRYYSRLHWGDCVDLHTCWDRSLLISKSLNATYHYRELQPKSWSTLFPYAHRRRCHPLLPTVSTFSLSNPEDVLHGTGLAVL